MATLINPTQYVSGTGPSRYYNVTLADIKAAGAVQTVDIDLDTYMGGAVMLANTIKHTIALVGTGITTATARLRWVTTAATTDLGDAALTVTAAPGDTDGTHSKTGVTPLAGDVNDNVSKLVMRITVTVGAGFLNAATAGEIHANAIVVNMPVS